MVELPTGPKAKPERAQLLQESGPNSTRSPTSPMTEPQQTSLSTHSNNNGSTPSNALSAPPGVKVTSTVQLARPFLTKGQIRFAHTKTIDNIPLFNQRRNQIFQYLLKICYSFKFPIRILETAMYYYQRYFIYNKFDVSIYSDVGITSLFIASKKEDTIKKLRDILSLFNQLRGVNLSLEQFENHRKRILSLEFRLLETISFDFRSFHSEEFLIKYNKKMAKSKDDSYMSWLILFDSYQTDLSLKYPPHIIAMSCIIISNKLTDASLKLTTDHVKYKCDERLINECLQDLLSLYVDGFNFTGLSKTHNEYHIKFVHIKGEFNDSRPLFLTDVDEESLGRDEFFNERDFSNGERRYMLENQKKRLYAEVEK